MNSPEELNSAASTASADDNSAVQAYFSNLNAETYWQVLRGTTPLLSEQPAADALALIGVLLERLCAFTGMRLDRNRSDTVIDRIYQLYPHYRAADLRLFFNLCCIARFGLLEAYDRDNPQILFIWLNRYNDERLQAAESARAYYGE